MADDRSPSVPDPGNDDLGARTARALLWSALERWSVRLISLGVFLVLARVIDAAAFGLVSMTSVVTTLLLVFVDSGFSKTLVQRKSLCSSLISTCFWTSMGLAAVLFTALYLAAPTVASAFGEPGLTPLLRVSGLVLPIGAIQGVPAALLQRAMDFRTLAFRQVTGTIIGGVVGLAVAATGGGAWSLVLQTIAGNLIGAVSLWMQSSWRPTLEFSFSELKEVFRFGLPILGNDLMIATQGNIDKLLIGAFFDPATLGVYFVAQRIAGVVLELIASFIGNVSLTTFSRIGEDVSRRNRAFNLLTFLTAAVAFPAFACLGIFAETYLPLLVGSGWDGAVPIFQVMAVSNALGAIMFFDTSVLIAAGRPGTALSLGLVQNAIGIGLVIAAAPLGILAVALSRLAMRLVTWPIRLWALRRQAGILVGPYFKTFIHAVAPLIPVSIICAYLYLADWARSGLPQTALAFIGTAVLLVGFFGLLWLTSPRDLRAAAVGRLRREK